MSPDSCPICAASLPAPAIGAPDRLHATPGRFSVAVCSQCHAGVTIPRVRADRLTAFYPAAYSPYARKVA